MFRSYWMFDHLYKLNSSYNLSVQFLDEKRKYESVHLNRIDPVAKVLAWSPCFYWRSYNHNFSWEISSLGSKGKIELSFASILSSNSVWYGSEERNAFENSMCCFFFFFLLMIEVKIQRQCIPASMLSL